MNAKEAIKSMENLNLILSITESERKSVSMAINALEKQNPKKPQITAASEEVEYMKCPNCKLTTVLYHGMRPSYCGNCGQKLKWW